MIDMSRSTKQGVKHFQGKYLCGTFLTNCLICVLFVRVHFRFILCHVYAL